MYEVQIFSIGSGQFGSNLKRHQNTFRTSKCLWRIWIRRNLWLFQNDNKHIGPWIAQTNWLANEFCFSQSVHNNHTPTSQVVEDLGDFNFNIQVDASYCENSLLAGFAVVCINNAGVWVDVKTSTFNTTDALTA